MHNTFFLNFAHWFVVSRHGSAQVRYKAKSREMQNAKIMMARPAKAVRAGKNKSKLYETIR